VVGVSTCLFAVYLLIGVVIAKLFAGDPESINRLYASDLVGAALGAGAAVWLMRLITPPGCIFLSAAILSAAGLRQARRRGAGWVGVSGGVSLVLLLGAFFAKNLPDPVPDKMKFFNSIRATAEVSRWDPVFRVDVTPSPLYKDALIINHDALLGSILRRFDGDFSKMTKFDSDSRSFPFALVPKPKEVLIIGAAGGHEVLASKYFGAERVTGVELNPATVALVRKDYADYTGHLYRLPGVDYLNGEGRSYLAASDRSYDIIFFVAPDSYAAMNAATAGAYVLSESYLYTVGMIQLAVKHLTDDGVICMQFGEPSYEKKPNRTARYVASAREAFHRLGIDDFENHVMVSSASGLLQPATILLKRTRYTETDAERFLAAVGKAPGDIARFVPGKKADGGLVTQIITRPRAELPALFASYRYDVSPVFDDSPFFWHFVRFHDLLGGEADNRQRMNEDGFGEGLLLFLFALGVVYAAIFLLLPFFVIRKTWLELPHKALTAIYFAAIGTGFMFFEIVLIQKLTLLLGYPTYSLSVTLASMLAFTGIGSFLTTRYANRYRTALAVMFAVVVAATLFYQFGMDRVVEAALPAPLPVRVALAVVMLFPACICLGGFMPVGLSVAASHTRHREQYIAWGWAVNGFFSVISSISATILSMTFGFSAVMYVALALYVVATAAILAIPDARAA
jgi:hypothetical protein